MLNWKIERSKGMLLATSMTESSTWQEITHDFVYLWLELLELVSLECRDSPFDSLTFELWIDSGRVIAYCTKEKSNDRIVTVQLVSQLILRESEILPDPDESPELFESKAMALEFSIWKLISKSALNKDVRSKVTSLRKLHGFRVWRQSADNTRSRHEMFLVS